MATTLFGAQCDVVTRQQLTDGDVTDDRVRAQVDAGRWRQLTPTLFVLHNGPLTLEQQWWAATLAVGPLAGRSALQSWGVTGWEPGKVEVLVRRGEHPPIPRGVPILVHESRRFEPSDIHLVREPRRVGVARAAVDAAAWTKQPRSACGLLAAVVQQGKAPARQLSEELARAGAIRHRRLLRAVLNDIGGGAQALTEVDLGRVCRRYGLLVPERQLVRVDSHGRRRYVDARVCAPNGRSVLVEVDGALHLIASTYWQDMLRLNEILIGGEPVLRFPSIALHLDEATVGNQLRRACGLDPLTLAA